MLRLIAAVQFSLPPTLQGAMLRLWPGHHVAVLLRLSAWDLASNPCSLLGSQACLQAAQAGN